MSEVGSTESGDCGKCPRIDGETPPRANSVERRGLRLIVSLWGTAILGSLGSPALAKGAIVCPTTELQSISTGIVIERAHVANPAPVIHVTRLREANEGPRPREGQVNIAALGPVLGSMDSRVVRMHSVCTKRGVLLTVTLVRSAHYHGAALQNVIWRPRITMVARLRVPAVSFGITWRMRLTSGKEVRSSQTPTYPVQDYPVTVEKEIHLHGAHGP